MNSIPLMVLSSLSLLVFQIFAFVREYPLFVTIWLTEPVMLEMMGTDSLGTVAGPGQAARQCVNRLLAANKATNLSILTKLRPWDPFLSFYLFCRKSVALKVLSNLGIILSFFELGGGPAIENKVRRSWRSFFKPEDVSFLKCTEGLGGLS